MLSKLLRRLFGNSDAAASRIWGEPVQQRVLPPETPQPLQDLLNKIEGYINAIKMQKDTFDTSGIRYLCQTQNLDPAALLKLQTLATQIAAYQQDVNECIGMASS